MRTAYRGRGCMGTSRVPLDHFAVRGAGCGALPPRACLTACLLPAKRCRSSGRPPKLASEGRKLSPLRSKFRPQPQDANRASPVRVARCRRGGRLRPGVPLLSEDAWRGHLRRGPRTLYDGDPLMGGSNMSQTRILTAAALAAALIVSAASGAGSAFAQAFAPSPACGGGLGRGLS